MGNPRKVLEEVLSGNSDANVRFLDLCSLLTHLGFNGRIKGDHHIYYFEGIPEILNLQPLRDGKAKPYQVRQVRNLINRYRLGG